MTSESLFVKCKSCNKDISKSSKVCPHCETKQKRLGIFSWIGIILGGLIIIGVVNAPNNKNQTSNQNQNNSITNTEDNTTDSQIPKDQAEFIKNISQYSEDFIKAKNELQQSAMRDQRKQTLSRSLRGLSVQSWIGTINKLETNNDGQAILSLRISPNIEIKTWNNSLSDINANTIISKGSELYKNLFNLSTGQKVIFSGDFLPSKSDFIEETSLTIKGSMESPEFLFKFKSVTSIK